LHQPQCGGGAADRTGRLAAKFTQHVLVQQPMNERLPPRPAASSSRQCDRDAIRFSVFFAHGDAELPSGSRIALQCPKKYLPVVARSFKTQESQPHGGPCNWLDASPKWCGRLRDRYQER
jgi:hypothetical protein